MSCRGTLVGGRVDLVERAVMAALVAAVVAKVEAASLQVSGVVAATGKRHICHR